MKRPKSKIKFFANCAMCTAEVPEGESFESYGRLTVGFTKDGKVQVWCVRHDAEVFTIGPESFAQLMHSMEGMECSCCHAPLAEPPHPDQNPVCPPNGYAVAVYATATSEPGCTIVRVARDHKDGGWQSVTYQGRRYQMYERSPGHFWINLSDPGRAGGIQ